MTKRIKMEAEIEKIFWIFFEKGTELEVTYSKTFKAFINKHKNHIEYKSHKIH